MPLQTPYQQLKRADFITQVSDLMDDPTQVYWRSEEIGFWLNEALLYWGGCTGYWRQRGTFQANPGNYTQPIAFANSFDMSVKFPTLRARTYTYDQLVREIQYMLLEAPNGLSGAGMSQQVTVTSILIALQDARNRFVLDTGVPVTQTLQAFPQPLNNSGVYTLSDSTAILHRIVWKDPGGIYYPLWRQDAWAADKGVLLWTVDPGIPYAYSESELSPLQVQFIPPPTNVGSIGLYTAKTIQANLNVAPNQTVSVPDEWAHAVKYGALSQILSSSGQIADELRGQYCEKRYQQSVKIARDASTILRALINETPLNISPLSQLDLGYPNWMNTYGTPFVAGTLYDILTLCPGQLDQTYGIGVDLVQSAPIPGVNDYLPIGEEDIDNLKDYVCHLLAFKCGGKDFTNTMSGYDSFMSKVALRKYINAAKIQYLTPLFSQPQSDQGYRPDRKEVNA